ncbi:MAG: hypothetical protein RR646_07775 [Erysipelotrichaceae bacterium]
MKYHAVAKKKEPILPSFGFKSAILIGMAGFISAGIIPYILYIMGIDYKLPCVLISSIAISLALAYSRCFIESKEGLTKKFWYTFIGFALLIGMITYSWLYLQLYM